MMPFPGASSSTQSNFVLDLISFPLAVTNVLRLALAPGTITSRPTKQRQNAEKLTVWMVDQKAMLTIAVTAVTKAAIAFRTNVFSSNICTDSSTCPNWLGNRTHNRETKSFTHWGWHAYWVMAMQSWSGMVGTLWSCWLLLMVFLFYFSSIVILLLVVSHHPAGIWTCI